MKRITETGRSEPRLPRLWPHLLGGMMLAGALGAGQARATDADALARHGAAAPTTYRVINLRPADENLTGVPLEFNASDQIAFTTVVGGNQVGWFYNGSSLVDIGYLNGPITVVAGLNDAGQVTGASLVGGPGFENYHAFVWSQSSGMRDLGTLGGFNSNARDINNLGHVVGSADDAQGRQRAFRWSPGAGMVDLGFLAARPDSFSIATALNDAGVVVGVSTVADGNHHAFAWTRRTGMKDLGTLGGSTSVALAIGAGGQVAGDSTVRGLYPSHAFLWTRAGGMRDLGTAGGTEAFVRGMSDNGQHIYGMMFFADGDRRAFSWTRATGMRNIGTLGGSDAIAHGVNNRGHIVGGSFTTNDVEFNAFVWTAQHGMVDLNRRLRNPPAGFAMRSAYAISDNGFIVGESNAGMVLLVPDTCPATMHAVGPLMAPELVPAGEPFESSVSFSNGNKSAGHNVTWNWGDGSGDQQGNARERDGAGLAKASHAYTAPGIYTVTAKVGDRSGKGPTVSRTVVAFDPPGGAAAGSGWFISPRGAHNIAGNIAASPTDRVEFSFIVPSAANANGGSVKPSLNVTAAGLRLRSEDVRRVATADARARFEGSGTVNGKSGYRFTLTTPARKEGAREQDRFGLKIWHTDPATGNQVVDYDNLGAGPGGTGSSFKGKIAVN